MRFNISYRYYVIVCVFWYLLYPFEGGYMSVLAFPAGNLQSLAVFELWSDRGYSGFSSYSRLLSISCHLYLLIVRWDFMWIDWSIPCINKCKSLFSFIYCIILGCTQRIRSCFDVVIDLFMVPLYHEFPRYSLALFRVSVVILLYHSSGSDRG